MDGSGGFICNHCNKSYKTEGTRSTHIRKYHSESSEEHITSTKVSCNFCKKTFVNDERLETHLNKYHADNYVDNSRVFIHNGIQFSLNSEVVNSQNQILNDFNISTFDPPQSPDSPDIFTNSILAVSEDERVSFKSSTKTFCIKYHKQFIISLLNINSLQHKFADIVFLLDKQYVDILVINETKLNSQIDDSRFENTFYQMIRRDRPEKGSGGIMVFIKKTITTKIIQIDDTFEMISILFSPNPKLNVSLIACYRPPHKENEDLFLEALDKKSNRDVL